MDVTSMQRKKMSHLPANRAPDAGMLLGGQQRLGFSQQDSPEKCTDRITECSVTLPFAPKLQV